MPDYDNPAPASAELEHQRLTSLINSMADGVIALDEECRIVLYNAASLNIIDVNDNINGKPLRDVLRAYDKEDNLVNIEGIVKGGNTPTYSRDYLIKYSDNSTANLYLSIAPVHLGYGQLGERGFVLVMRDITREKSLEEERDEFISVVSHELRTPITIAEGNIGNAELISERSGNLTEIKQALKEAHEQVIFLSAMVNDLSTLSRAERGGLKVDVKPVNARDLVEELATEYRPQSESRGVEMRTDISPHLEIFHSSQLYIREILQNFLNNAIKYTQNGYITLGAKPANAGVVFWVSDTGIGISRGDQEKIFNKFFRSEDYRTKETKGTGLGLYITKKLEQLIKANIKVDSELNKGSTFTLTVPDLEKQ